MSVNLHLYISRFIKIILPLILGVVILYFLYKGTDFQDLWLNVKDAKWSVLLFSLLFGLTGNVIRGLRWELLINPLGYYPKRSRLIYAVLGNYAVNFALPRAGEIWRCGVIAKSDQVPFPKLIGTLIIDRLFDTLMVLLILLLTFFLNAAFFYQNSDQFNLPGFLFSPYLYLGLVLSSVAFALVFVFLKHHPIVRKISAFFATIWADMKKVWSMKKKKRFIVYTLGIWVSYFFYFYTTFFAFDFTKDLGVAAGLFVFTLSSISMGIPSNGGLGPWQASVVLGLCAFAVGIDMAKVFATAVFAIQSIWVVVCGLFGIFALMLDKKTSIQPS